MIEVSPLRRLNIHDGPRGRLIAVEGTRDVPFEIARVYYILPGDGEPRGFHAHRALEQLMICVAGSCRIDLDRGAGRVEHRLKCPDEALFVGTMTWREIHDLSPDAVLLVLASHHFDEADYIRDYDAFLAEATIAHGG